MTEAQAIHDAFPADDYYDIAPEKTQFHVVNAIENAFDEGYETVLLDSPTGTGKSLMNLACANLASSAFYTTPLKSLRTQLVNDSLARSHIEAVRSRADYMCYEPDDPETCAECPINLSPDESCIGKSSCGYWQAKETAMKSHTAAITFAYLIADSNLPVYTEGGKQLSFDDRDLLVVDEMDELESQVATLFSGFVVGSSTLPDVVIRSPFDDLSPEVRTHDDVLDVLDRIRSNVQEFIFQYEGRSDYQQELEQCDTFMSNYDRLIEDIDDDRTWTVDVKHAYRTGRNGPTQTMQLSPVRVDRFLAKNVWSRSNKRILSTATMPLRNNTQALATRLGLDPETTTIVKVPMPFPVSNRPIHERYIASFSSGGDTEHWDSILDTLDELAGIHAGQNGVVHTVSYSRAQKIRDTIEDEHSNLTNNIYVHQPKYDAGPTIKAWLNSDSDILLSPSVMTGVDLYDDRCRWAAMLKTPYPHMGNSRIDYLVNDLKDWPFYNDQAARAVVQAAGRGVRHADDFCDFYLLDASMKSLFRRAAFPQWFLDALTDTSEPVSARKADHISWTEPDVLDF